MYENECVKKGTFWISFLYSEIQYSGSKASTNSKEHDSFVSEIHGENREFLFCEQFKLKVTENGRNLSAV